MKRAWVQIHPDKTGIQQFPKTLKDDMDERIWAGTEVNVVGEGALSDTLSLLSERARERFIEWQERIARRIDG